LKPVQAHTLTITSDNGNGLIREYFHKKKLFKAITDKQIVEVQNRLNRRPRKILGYKTPAEVFFDTITKSYVAV
jgi:IS30 family transposase